MNNKIIKLIVNEHTASGYNHATLFMGADEQTLSDCGALYLSNDEIDNLTDVLQHGVATCNSSRDDRFVFEFNDKTQDMANDY